MYLSCYLKFRPFEWLMQLYKDDMLKIFLNYINFTLLNDALSNSTYTYNIGTKRLIKLKK